MIEFNINEWVRVKLNDDGRAELKRQHDEINAHLNGKLGEWKGVDEVDGWSKWQAWDLMNRFGHMMMLGSRLPFYSEIQLKTQPDDFK